MLEILWSVLIGLSLMGIGGALTLLIDLKYKMKDLHDWLGPNDEGRQYWREKRD